MHASIRLALCAAGVSLITLAASGAPVRLPFLDAPRAAAPAPAMRAIEAAPISHSSFTHETPAVEPAADLQRRLTDA